MDDASYLSPEEQERLERMRKISQLGPEELQRLNQEAMAQAQAVLSNLTPEQQQRAWQEAQREAGSRMQAYDDIFEQARKVAGGAPAQQTAPAAAPARPKFCGNCGAPVVGGRFCTNCGHPLQA